MGRKGEGRMPWGYVENRARFQSGAKRSRSLVTIEGRARRWKRDREPCRRRTWGNKKPLYEKTFTKRRPRPRTKEFEQGGSDTTAYPERILDTLRSPREISSSNCIASSSEKSDRGNGSTPGLGFRFLRVCTSSRGVATDSTNEPAAHRNVAWKRIECCHQSWASFFYYYYQFLCD